MSTDLIVSSVGGEAELLKQQREIVAKFGDGLPWNVDHYTALIRDAYESTMHSFLRTGRLLLVARACTDHGEWEQVLSDAGIARSTAWRMMRAAETVTLEGRIQQLPKSKVAELMALPESEIKELDAGGKIDGKDVDDIARMTRSELRAWRAERDAEIRELKESLATKDERAAAREREIERLTEDNRKLRRRWKDATPDQQIEALRQDLSEIALSIRSQIAHASTAGEEISSLRTRAGALVEAGVQTGIDQTVYLAGVFAEIERDLRALRSELGVPDQISADPTPAWLTDADEQVR